MTKAEKLKRWRAVLRRRSWTVVQAAAMLGISKNVGYNWNCGAQTIPEGRIKQLEAMK
jgi:hypothetical protein